MVTASVTRDPTDAKWLALAVDGQADYPLTVAKRHLLRLKTYGRTQVVRPAAFKRALRRGEGPLTHAERFPETATGVIQPCGCPAVSHLRSRGLSALQALAFREEPSNKTKIEVGGHCGAGEAEWTNAGVVRTTPVEIAKKCGRLLAKLVLAALGMEAICPKIHLMI